MRRLISSGSTFEAEIGYSRAVVDGEWVFVSGTTGFDYSTMTISDDVAAQADQCFRNIRAALAQAGAALADVVRVTYLLPDAADFPKCWPVLKQYLGDIRPAATMMAVGLSDPRMKIEVEVTARKREGRVMDKVNLAEALAAVAGHWRPRVVAELNGQEVKLVKFRGEFVWHKHDAEDELFLVVGGRFRMEFRDRTVELAAGELLVVPRGVEHRPVADDEVQVLLFEPARVRNTGDVYDPVLTVPTAPRERPA